jgi:hypothetical protein
VWVVSSKYPDEDRSASEGADARAELPSRAAGTGRSAPAEARAELRDRETYYTELRFAVHCQSRSIPRPRAALDDQGPGSDAWTQRPGRDIRTDGQSWDGMGARLGDTWT